MEKAVSIVLFASCAPRVKSRSSSKRQGVRDRDFRRPPTEMEDATHAQRTSIGSLKLESRCFALVDAVCHRLGIALLPLERQHLMRVVLDFPGRWRTVGDEELRTALTEVDLSTKECDLLCAWMGRNSEMFRGVVVLRLILLVLKNPKERADLVQHVYMRVGQVAYMLDAATRAAG